MRMRGKERKKENAVARWYYDMYAAHFDGSKGKVVRNCSNRGEGV